MQVRLLRVAPLDDGIHVMTKPAESIGQVIQMPPDLNCTD
jgi:hypothetical protein